MPAGALAELLALAGVQPCGEIAFGGADPVFRTPFRVATAGAAEIGRAHV